MVKNGIIVEIFGLFVIYILASAVAVFIWWVANKTRITREAEAQQQQNDRVIQAQQQQLRVAIEKCSTARIIAGQSWLPVSVLPTKYSRTNVNTI